jgi:hypothetical protein
MKSQIMLKRRGRSNAYQGLSHVILYMKYIDIIYQSSCVSSSWPVRVMFRQVASSCCPNLKKIDDGRQADNIVHINETGTQDFQRKTKCLFKQTFEIN